jgi:predicted nucleic acid-binding protein
MIYLLDTNAVIKMLYGKHLSYVLKSFYDRKINLVYHAKILKEYVEVAHRLKNQVPPERARAFFVLLQEYGFEIKTLGKSPMLTDRDDEIFVQTLNSAELRGEKVALVTDNQKDFKNAKGLPLMTFQEFTLTLVQL